MKILQKFQHAHNTSNQGKKVHEGDHEFGGILKYYIMNYVMLEFEIKFGFYFIIRYLFYN